jgi:hypothetical protein
VSGFYPDVTPKLLTAIRDIEAVKAIVKDRVRSPEPAPDDAQGSDKYKAFVVLVPLAAPRHRQLPIQFPRFAVRCYGRNPSEAAALRWAVVGGLHRRGPHVYPNGLGIYQILADEGGEPDTDPDTKQPLQVLFIEAPATAQAVTA